MIQYDSSEDDLTLNNTQAILKPGTLKKQKVNFNWILAIKCEKVESSFFLIFKSILHVSDVLNKTNVYIILSSLHDDGIIDRNMNKL